MRFKSNLTSKMSRIRLVSQCRNTREDQITVGSINCGGLAMVYYHAPKTAPVPIKFYWHSQWHWHCRTVIRDSGTVAWRFSGHTTLHSIYKFYTDDWQQCKSLWPSLCYHHENHGKKCHACPLISVLMCHCTIEIGTIFLIKIIEFLNLN